MKLKNSQKMLKCVAEFAYEKDLCNAFVTPIISDLIEEPVLYKWVVAAASDMMKKDEHIASFGLPGVVAAVYAMDLHKQKGLVFRSSSDEELVLGGIAEYGRHFSLNEMQDNPYVRNIRIPEADIAGGRYSFTKNDHAPYELFMYDVPAQMGKYGCMEIPKIGYFDKRQEFMTLNEGGKAWMSLTPNEICTMEKPVQNAHGKVLTLGLGLGYFAYMAAIKDNVESVTVIEKNPDIIAMFSDYILPQFGKAAGKITIIQSDAIAYVNGLEDGSFDYCFADIWENSSLSQIGIYMKCREALRRLSKMKTNFWINDSFMSQFHEIAAIGVINEGYTIIGAPKFQCSTHGAELGRMETYVGKLMEDVEFRSAYDIKKYTSYEYIDEAIQKTEIIY